MNIFSDQGSCVQVVQAWPHSQQELATSPALAKGRYSPCPGGQVQPGSCELECQALLPSSLQAGVHHKRGPILEGDDILQAGIGRVNDLHCHVTRYRWKSLLASTAASNQDSDRFTHLKDITSLGPKQFRILQYEQGFLQALLFLRVLLTFILTFRNRSCSHPCLFSGPQQFPGCVYGTLQRDLVPSNLLQGADGALYAFLIFS